MWQLYDALIEGVDATRRVDFAFCGAWRAWVESDGKAGLASLLLPGGAPAAPTGELRQYRGMRLRDLAALAKSVDPQEAALGVAALNAYYNDSDKLRHAGAQLFSSGSEDGDAFLRLLPEARGKKVATVGHFNGVDGLYAPACEFSVFEQEPRPGDLPESAEEELLPSMDLVFITGMAFTNKTLPKLLQLTKECRVVITGPSLPLADTLFDFGADVLSGLVVSDIKRGRNAAVSENWRDIFECSQKVMWLKNSAAECCE
ncbi:MAG: hypothetical protein IJH59_02405, partial [Firmicutes bacterium]|nr:hypothetical protein [Bacillota bacterium]